MIPSTYSQLVMLRDRVCPMAEGYVYFVAQEYWSEVFVKIVHTKNFLERWSKLQTDNIGAFPALLIRGDEYLERILHEAFAAWKARGEWFRLAGELHELIRDFGATPSNLVPEFRELELASRRNRFVVESEVVR